MVSEFDHNIVNNQLLGLDWVKSCTNTVPTNFGDEIEYSSTYVIGVDYNAE